VRWWEWRRQLAGSGDKPSPEFFTPLPDDEWERYGLVVTALAEEEVRVLTRRMVGAAQSYYQPSTEIIALRPGLDSHCKFLVPFHVDLIPTQRASITRLE